MSSYWQSAYDDDERLRRLERVELGVVFAWLNEDLPSIGTAIDWAQVDGEHVHWMINSDVGIEQILPEFLATVQQYDGFVLHDGDSLSPFPVRIEPGELATAIEALLEIPEHHYFIDEHHRWVGVFRMEGDVDLVTFP